MGDAADAYFIIAAGVAIVQIRPPPPPPSQSQSQSQSTTESNHGSSVPESESASAAAAAPVVSSRKANDRRFFASIVSPSIAALALPPSAKPNATTALAPIDGVATGAEISGGAAQKSAAAKKSVDRAGSSLRGSDSIIAQSLAFGETAAANNDEDDDDIGESTDHFAQIDNHTTLSSSSVSSALAAATAATAKKPTKSATVKTVRPSRRESLLSPANPEAAFQVYKRAYQPDICTDFFFRFFHSRRFRQT